MLQQHSIHNHSYMRVLCTATWLPTTCHTHVATAGARIDNRQILRRVSVAPRDLVDSLRSLQLYEFSCVAQALVKISAPQVLRQCAVPAARKRPVIRRPLHL